MKRIKNIRDCVLGVPGIGAVKPGETVDMPDDIANGCLTAPASWQEVKPVRANKKLAKKHTNVTELATIKMDVTSMEDKDHGSN